MERLNSNTAVPAEYGSDPYLTGDLSATEAPHVSGGDYSITETPAVEGWNQYGVRDSGGGFTFHTVEYSLED